MKPFRPLRRAFLLAFAGLSFLAGSANAAEPVVLKVGDQNYYNIRASFELSKALEGAPYKVDWAPFQAAAPLAEALNAGAIDIGFLGDSGFLFLAAKSSSAKLIGITRQNLKTVALLVPKESTARNVADLKGKKVAYWPGAWSQQLTLGALDKAGLAPNYVDFVKLMPLDAANAESIAAKRAAIEDFLVRLKKARAWVEANIDTYADAWAVRASLDREVSRHWLREAKLTVYPVDAKATADLQVTADFLHKEKVLPAALDVRKVIDTSFNATLAR